MNIPCAYAQSIAAYMTLKDMSANRLSRKTPQTKKSKRKDKIPPDSEISCSKIDIYA